MGTHEMEHADDHRAVEGAVAAHNFSVPVKTGLSEERIVTLCEGQSVTTILQIISVERGCAIEELVLVREGEDEQLVEAILVDADYPHQRRHHVHHAGQVAVTIYYQAGEHRGEFKRHEPLEKLLAWAIEVFNIDPSMATEFELARHGQKEELPLTEHVGHLAGRQHELALDLVRGDIANGSCL